MKSLTGLVVVGTILVALLGGIFFALRNAPQETATPTGTVFTDALPTDIKSVTVKNASGQYRFFYEDGGYVADDIPTQIVDTQAFTGFMTNCAGLSATRRIAGEESLERYGLKTPAAVGEVEFFDGTVTKIALGDTEPLSGDYYVTVEGADGVYVMKGALARQFFLSKKQVISTYVTPPLAVTSPLSAIRDVTFTGGGLKSPVTIRATAEGVEQLAALSFGTATHIVESAGTYQLDQSYGIEILGSLFGIQARDIEGYGLSREEIEKYGFDDPYMTIEYDMINGVSAEKRHIRLMLSQIDQENFYATLDGSGAVYVIGREPFVDLRFERLPLRWFLTPMLMDVKSVTVQWAEGSYRFALDNSDNRNPTVTSEENLLDVTLFRSFFRLITSAAHDGTYLGELKKPEAGPILSITYEYENPQKSPDLMELYSGGPRRMNVFVNGAGEFAMKDTFVQRVIEGCANLSEGYPIEENW